MDQDYFYVELPSGTVVSHTTKKAAETAARDFGGKIITGSKKNPVVPVTAPGDPEEGLVAGPDPTSPVDSDI